MSLETHHKMLTAPKAAEMLGVSYNRLLKLCKRGKVAYEDWSVGDKQARYMISTVEIYRILHRRTAPSTAKESPVKFKSDLF